MTSIGKTIFTQLIATCGALLLINQVGLIDGWTSPNLARLTEGNSTLSLTPSEASWVASFLKLGRFMSVVIVPVMIEVAGSKNAVLYSFIPVTASWVLTMVAKSAVCLYVARFLGGITIGLTFGVYPIYLAEISSPALRGTFNSITGVGWPLGTVISTVSETHLPEVASCAIYLLPCLLGILLFAWLPESPYQLVKNKDLIKARESLAWYRGHNHTETEMEEIVEFVESTNGVTLADKLKQFRSPPIYKAMILVTLAFTYPQLCGILNVIFYMEIILTNGKSHLVDPKDMVVYTNVILLVVSIVTLNVVDKLGRRFVLLTSSAMMQAALIVLGLHFFLLNYAEVDPVTIEALPVVSIMVLVGAYTIGFSPVMTTLLGEMFPVGIKSTAATIATFVSAFSGFVSTKTYQQLIDTIGETYVFWIYAAIVATAIPVVLFLLPETKGKTLQEIQNLLNKK